MARKRTCECGTCPKCEHRAYMHEYNRRLGNAEKMRQRAREYRELHIDDVRAADRARGHRVYDVLKDRARLAVTHAIEDGHLVRQPCEECGQSPVADDGRSLVHAHHDDYGAPLDVRWLCSACHGIEHRLLA